MVPVHDVWRLLDPDSYFDLSESLIILPVNYVFPFTEYNIWQVNAFWLWQLYIPPEIMALIAGFRLSKMYMKMRFDVCVLVLQFKTWNIELHQTYTCIKAIAIIEPAHDETYIKLCANSEDSDQTAHSCSLTRVFVDCMCLLQPPGYPKRDNENPCLTEWMYRLIWVFVNHTGLIVAFVMRWLIYIYELQRQKTYVRTCLPSLTSDQPAHSHNFSLHFCWNMFKMTSRW